MEGSEEKGDAREVTSSGRVDVLVGTWKELGSMRKFKKMVNLCGRLCLLSSINDR